MRVLTKMAGAAASAVVAALSVSATAPAAPASAPAVALGGSAAGATTAVVAPAATAPGGGGWLAQDGEWRADQDLNSLYGVARSAGVHDAWAQGVTGAGIGVALIDSGIAPVKGLDTAGKVINGPDLSFDSQAPNLRYLDAFGHGTHLAGVIAGRDPEIVRGRQPDPARFAGIAPDAHLVSVKVATRDGATDVSQVIAAIDWVVQHRNDPGLNIRVLNLSFGTDSLQDPRLDPLSYAVENAWRKGIVVVVAVGNEGAAQTRVAMPANNPYVIAVGAMDPHQTVSRRDDTVATFSTGGSAARHADILAAGRSVVSLRTPGSYVDSRYPEALVPGDVTGRYFRGSGTSQATAVVSGAAALLLSQRPRLTPDQVKRLLVNGADPMPRTAGDSYGAGQLNLTSSMALPPLGYRQRHPAATGQGTLEGARGSAHVADADTGVELTGEQDIFGKPWRPAVWAADAALDRSWYAGSWNGTEWAGTGWTGVSWTARTWSGRTWSGRTWSGALWSGRTWSDAVWTGRTWSGALWSGRTWSGRTWSGRTWSGGRWS